MILVEIQNAGAKALQGGFTTLGTPFLQGALGSGKGLAAEIGGRIVPVQVDVKNTYADGSARTAILTFERPDLPSWDSVKVNFRVVDAPQNAQAVSLVDVLSRHNTVLTFDILGQGNTKAAAEAAAAAATAPIRSLAIDVAQAFAEAMAQGKVSFWQNGPLATQGRVEIPVGGTPMRIVIDATAYADGNVRFVVNLNNDRAMEDVQGGWMHYRVKAALDGQTAFEHRLTHAQYQRTNLEFASSDKHGIQGLGDPRQGWLNIKHDLDYLKATKAVFQWNSDLVPSTATIQGYQNTILNDPQWGTPFYDHKVTRDMGTSGGRPDIGLSTANVVNWLLGAEPYAAEFALGQARAASAIPWHFHDMPRGIPITTENYPALRPWAWVTPGRPGDPASHGLTQRPATDTGWGWNTSHQPDLSFVPYLLTGERWIYDNLMSQASASLLAATPTPRLETERPVINDQIRALAWSMRQIEHAAWSAVDGSAEQRFFDRAADANWNYLLQKVPEWNARHGEIAGLIYAEYTYGHHTPVWQSYMVANVAGMAALRGREKAAQLLDWMGNYLIGVINSEAKGLPPYNVITGDVPIRWNGEFLDTWAELADVLRSRGQLAETSFPVGHLQEYYRMYAGALAHLHMVTGREDAKRAFEKLFALGPVPGATLDHYATAPQFGVVLQDIWPTYGMINGGAYGNGGGPVRREIGAGPDTIVIKVAQDVFNGNAQYKVWVDGRDLGTFTASAMRSLAEADTLVIRGDFGDTVQIRVQFLNDGWGGAWGFRDRNLHVLSVQVNGADVLPQPQFLANGGASWSATVPVGDPGQAGPPRLDPVTHVVTAGPGTDEIVLKIAQDWHQGSAQFAVLVDGQQVGPVLTASALRGSGQTDTLIVRGDFDVLSRIEVRFLNDLNQGPNADRNLYVTEATANGIRVGIDRTDLRATGDAATLDLRPAGAALLPQRFEPKTTTLDLGEGPDRIVIQFAQDWFRGDAQFQVLVDGRPVGNPISASALRSQGQTDTLILRGDFTADTSVALRFLNDLDRGLNADRNLYVLSATANGIPVPIDRTELRATGDTAMLDLWPAVAALEPVPALEPVTHTLVVGEGPDRIVVRLAQDWFRGSGAFEVAVDGRVIGGPLNASALRASGQADTLILQGDFDAASRIAIRFLNDLDRGPNADRNLYVLSATANGVPVRVENGFLDATGDTATLDLSAAGRALLPERFAPKTTTLNVGSSPDHAGPDTIVIKLAQDWFRGDAQFQVLVDGRPVGNPIAASALADQNDPDTLILRGNFSAASKVQIRFLNDLDLGGPHTDRNLHVLSATANRVPVGIDDTFLDATGETATLDLSPARLALADPTWFGFTFVTPASGARTAGVVRVFENGALTAVHLMALGPDQTTTVRVDADYGASTRFAFEFQPIGVPPQQAGQTGVFLSGILLEGDSLRFGAGRSDMLRGNQRLEVMFHNNVPDAVVGGAANDIFLYEGGSVRITTGSGRDIVAIRDDGRYVITDFQRGVDVVYVDRAGVSERYTATRQGQDVVLTFDSGAEITLLGYASGSNWQTTLSTDILFT